MNGEDALPTNSYGWPLPVTDALLAQSPYEPLTAPGENIAERLLMIAHLGFNSKVWSSRLDRYWDAFFERVDLAVNSSPTVARFSDLLSEDLASVSLRPGQLLHEKNLLTHPQALPQTSVDDYDVLQPFREHPRDLVDRVRMWSYARRIEAQSAAVAAVEGEAA